MRVLVVGAGAVGSWIGGAMAAGGAEVCLAEPMADRRAALAESGLTLVTGSRTIRARPTLVSSIGEAAATGAIDAAIVAVKSYHTAAVAGELADAGAPSVVVSIQNGIGNEEVLAGALPNRAIVRASLTTGLSLDAAGAVHGTSKGGVGVGAPPSGPDMTEVADALAAGGLKVRLYPDQQAMKWSKLLMNLLGSATSAILGWPPSRVFADRRLFDLERSSWLEAVSVMRALSLQPVALPDYPVPLYVRAVTMLPPALGFRVFGGRLSGARGDRLPSVAGDLAAGRTITENSVLTGAVVASGEAGGVPVPVCRALDDLVETVTTDGSARAAFAGRPERLVQAVLQ